ncbi:MAG: dienelactone hydrolase family protein [Vicinamibacterales bacterium]
MGRRTLHQRLDDLPVRMEQHELLVGSRFLTYGVLVPKTPVPPAGYPMIVALHYGTPEDPGLSPYFGLGYVGQLVLPALQDLNAVVIAPDAPEASWAHPGSVEAVLAVVADVKTRVRIDGRRTLVTGFSMGGGGAWFFAQTHPELFRAAIPMAAAPRRPDDDPAVPPAPLKMPVYAIHSRADATVPFTRVESGAQALSAQGGDVTLRLLDDVAHHMIPGYVDALHEAMPWVLRIWAR